MAEAIPLTPRQARALDHIARCPSCGQWAFWSTGSHWLEAELDPTHCHHGDETHHGRTAA